MLRLMKHLHYWIDLKRVIAKLKKGTSFWKQPLENMLIKKVYLQVHSNC